MTEKIGLVLSAIGALLLAGFTFFISHSIIATIIVFLVGVGYLYGQWTEAGTPYDIQEIRDELKKK